MLPFSGEEGGRHIVGPIRKTLDTVVYVVGALGYRPEVRRFDSR
jgi:hypothetical protein